MRLQQNGQSSNDLEFEQFSKWIPKVGDGKIYEPNDSYVDIDIPHELLIPNYDDSLQAIVQSTYQNFWMSDQNEGIGKKKSKNMTALAILHNYAEFCISTQICVFFFFLHLCYRLLIIAWNAKLL
jgi:hypothetical protein